MPATAPPSSGRPRRRTPSTAPRGTSTRASGAPGTRSASRKDAAPPAENADGSPTPENPTFSLAEPGPARIGVPNFFIDKFRIPPFLLPIYQAAGIQYGVRWEILAAINEIETDYGRNLNVSSAGAVGWMQFLPSTWRVYGVDANNDNVRDPYNPVDAIFAAARYLRAAGADTDIRKAVFAYNHANWYVDSVLLRAQVIGGLPSNLVGSLTGLTQGRFPVNAKATYAGELHKQGKQVREGNAAYLVESTGRRGIRIFSRSRAPVVAVNDGRIVRLGMNERLGRYVMLQDVYGNTYTYAHLGKVVRALPGAEAAARHAGGDPEGARAAEARRRAVAGRLGDRPPGAPRTAAQAGRARRPGAGEDAAEGDEGAPVRQPGAAQRRRRGRRPAGVRAHRRDRRRDVRGLLQPRVRARPQGHPAQAPARGLADRGRHDLGRLEEKTGRRAPHLLFEVRPAGRGAPRIDPKPILDGWKLLESTAIYRAAGKNPFFGRDAANPSIGQILLMSKEALVRRVLANPRIDAYDCGRHDILTGQVDRRVLATLEFLAASGLRPTVTSLKCGHGFYTASGNVSHHSSGNAVDIAAINGITISPSTQGAGSITELTIQRLLTLQGTMEPDQIISLMEFEGTDNTFAMGDHHDHIHVGFRPLYGTNSRMAKQVNAILKPKQWIKLIDRLGEIDNPTVRRKPSKYATPTKRTASHAHKGE